MKLSNDENIETTILYSPDNHNIYQNTHNDSNNHTPNKNSDKYKNIDNYKMFDCKDSKDSKEIRS